MELEQVVFGYQCASILFWVLIMFFVYYSYYVIRVKKQRIRLKLERQGVSGPSPSLVFGNLPEINRIMSTSRPKKRDVSNQENLLQEDYSLSIFPYFKRWTKQFGIFYLLHFLFNFVLLTFDIFFNNLLNQTICIWYCGGK